LEPPSAAVRAFIDAYVESIDLLRVLLFLARQPQQEWLVADVAAEAKLDPEVARGQLERLATHGLAARTEGSAGFRYAPRAVEFDEMVHELIALDDHRPVTLIRLVYARKSSSAQAFADAFRLRRS
jgi:DNA-binding IclR family transcriptional regulator